MIKLRNSYAIKDHLVSLFNLINFWSVYFRADIKRHSKLRSQTESRYVQTVPDGKCLCPDRPRWRVSMSWPSQTESAYAQTIAFETFSAIFVRSMSNKSRPSQTENVFVQTFVRSCPDHRALQIKFVLSNTKVLVRQCPDHRAFTSWENNYIMWCSAIPWRRRRQRVLKIWLFLSGQLVVQIERNLA